MITREFLWSPARVPPPVLFVFSGLTQYAGAALAVNLFRVLPAEVVAWWRVALSALVLLAWQRPWRRVWTLRDLAAAAVFGVVLAAMNLSFYLAVDRLPLGAAVSIEFIGPVAVAALTGRGLRERLGILLALTGVVVLALARTRSGSSHEVALGLLFIGITAACWAGYILLGRRVANRVEGLQGLTVAMAVGAIAFSPVATVVPGSVLADYQRVLALLVIAVCCSVLPYGIEQFVMRRIGAARFAILLALLPVAATSTGAVFLHQIPSPVELAGIVAVCGAILLSSAARSPA